MTLLQPDLIPQWYCSIDLDLLAGKIRLLVRVVPVACSLQIGFLLAVGLAESRTSSHLLVKELADYQICCRSAAAGYLYSENQKARLPDLL